MTVRFALVDELLSLLLEAIAEALQHENCKLKDLVFTENGIEDDGANAVHPAAVNNGPFQIGNNFGAAFDFDKQLFARRQ